MKKTIIVIAAFTFATLTQASTLSMFNGKFKVGKCTLTNDLERAYVSAKTDKKGNDVVQIQLYGEDATLIEMSASAYVTHNPNFELGNPIRETSNDFVLVGNKLTNTETHIYASGKKVIAQTEVLEKTSKGLLYTSYNPKNEIVNSCELLK